MGGAESEQRYLYFSIISAALVLSVMGLLFTAAMPGIDRWSKRFFLDYFIVLMACCFSCLADLILSYYPVPRAALYFVLVLECLFLSMPLPMLTVYLLHCCGENMRRSRLLHTVLGLWAAYFVLLARQRSWAFSPMSRRTTIIIGAPVPASAAALVAILLLTLTGVYGAKSGSPIKFFSAFSSRHTADDGRAARADVR